MSRDPWKEDRFSSRRLMMAALVLAILSALLMTFSAVVRVWFL